MCNRCNNDGPRLVVIDHDAWGIGPTFCLLKDNGESYTILGDYDSLRAAHLAAKAIHESRFRSPLVSRPTMESNDDT